MPAVFRRGGLRYYFFSNKGAPAEPPHIHVTGGGRDAKAWIEPGASIADSCALIHVSFPLLRVSSQTTAI